MSKPRIAEVLNVEVDEIFKVESAPSMKCFVDQHGSVLVKHANGELSHIFSGMLCYLINHPEEIQRASRFTQDEMAVLRILRRNGYIEAAKDSDGFCIVADPTSGRRLHLAVFSPVHGKGSD